MLYLSRVATQQESLELATNPLGEHRIVTKIVPLLPADITFCNWEH